MTTYTLDDYRDASTIVRLSPAMDRYFKDYVHIPQGIEVLGVDIETTMRGPEDDKSSPYRGGNEVLCVGIVWQSSHTEARTRVHCASPLNEVGARYCSTVNKMFFGHNLKFDLKYLLDKKRPMNLIAPMTFTGLKVWDTQLAAYILSGQRDKFISLDELCLRHGIPTKDPEVDELIKAGRIMEVEPQLLMSRCADDAAAALAIGLNQIECAQALGMLPICLNMMSALLAVTECEHNGMKVDLDYFATVATDVEGKCNSLIDTFETSIVPSLGMPPGVEVNLASPKDLGTLLYGGTFTYAEAYLHTYKNGRTVPRFRKQEYVWNGLVPGIPESSQDTSESTLLCLKATDAPLSATAVMVIDLVLEYRGLSKLLNTYIRKIPGFVDRENIIHHTLHQCATDTGRLSSARPNLQNVPMSETHSIKRGFISRFGSEGFIVEADYKQLEVVVLACICGDLQLIEDLRNGVDIHAATGEQVFGKGMTKEQRRVVKGINFGIIYGGGETTLAEQSGQPISLVRQIIRAFHHRYPGVRKHVKKTFEALCTDLKTSTYFIDKEVSNRKAVFLRSHTGRMYLYEENDLGLISYTKVANYQVQGLATGDVVPSTLGRMYRQLKHPSRLQDWHALVYMVNTVHDNIMFDVHKNVINEFLPWLKEIAEDAGNYLNKTIGRDIIELPLSVEISYGPNWQDQTKWNGE